MVPLGHRTSYQSAMLYRSVVTIMSQRYGVLLGCRAAKAHERSRICAYQRK